MTNLLVPVANFTNSKVIIKIATILDAKSCVLETFHKYSYPFYGTAYKKGKLPYLVL